jgi:hypothetical protein
MRFPVRLSLGAVVIAFAVMSAACGSAKSPGFGENNAIERYEFADGKATYTVTHRAVATLSLGPSFRSILPKIAVDALAVVGDSVKLTANYEGTADGVISGGADGQTMTLTYTSLDGTFGKVIRTDQVTLDSLPSDTVTYELASDGSATAKGGDPVTDAFWLSSAPVGCPTLPTGGAKPGATWTNESSLGTPANFFVEPITWDGSYEVDGDTAIVAEKSTDPSGLKLDVATLLSLLKSATGLDIDVVDVTADVAAKGEVANECRLATGSMAIREIEHRVKLKGTFSVSGSSLPSNLPAGNLLEGDIDIITTFERS